MYLTTDLRYSLNKAMPRDILHAVEIHADAATLFDAIATQRGQTAFWTTDAVLEPKLGSVASFGFPNTAERMKMRIERLAARVRAVLGSHPDLGETKMFGGLSFLLGGQMCCGVLKDQLVVSHPLARTAAPHQAE